MERPSWNLAFEVQPGRPRLSGTLTYGPPFPWQIKIEHDSLSVVPNARGMTQLVRYFILLAIAGPPCWFYIFWHSSSIPHNFWLVLFAALAPSIALMIGAGCYEWQRSKELKAGPWFHFSRTDEQFQFVRLPLSLSRAQAIRWELIFGCWVRGEDGSAQLWGDDISELQLVFHDQGKVFAFPLLGGLGPRGLNDAADLIANTTGLPLERITESRSLCNPYAKKTKMDSAGN